MNCYTFLKAVSVSEADKEELRGAAQRLLGFHQHLVRFQVEADCNPGIRPRTGNRKLLLTLTNRGQRRRDTFSGAGGSKNNKQGGEGQGILCKGTLRMEGGHCVFKAPVLSFALPNMSLWKHILHSFCEFPSQEVRGGETWLSVGFLLHELALYMLACAY